MAVRVVLTGSPWQKLAPNQLDGTQVIMRPYLMLRAAGSGGSEFSSASKARLPTEGRRQAGECSENNRSGNDKDQRNREHAVTAARAALPVVMLWSRQAEAPWRRVRTTRESPTTPSPALVVLQRQPLSSHSG